MPQPFSSKKSVLLLLLTAIGSIMLWWALASPTTPRHTISPAIHTHLQSGVVASMDSPIFTYSPTPADPLGWIVDANGADPREPADPWAEPAGVITFDYSGSELELQLAVGNYWGYLFVTVDGEPANLLPNIAGNRNGLGNPAGYKTFYEPEKVENGAPTTRWIRVHQAQPNQEQPNQTHTVRIEVWRSWGQTPIRGVAVDALPADPWPAWPGALLLFIASWLGYDLFRSRRVQAEKSEGWLKRLSLLPLPTLGKNVVEKSNLHNPTTLFSLAFLGVLIIGAGIATTQWIITLVGLALLGLASLVRPSIWLAALLFALPFYFGASVPILPNRSVGLIDVGILGGVALLFLRYLYLERFRATSPNAAVGEDFSGEPHPLDGAQSGHAAHGPNPKVGLGAILFLFIGWAFVATAAAQQVDVALREWRTIFLYAGLFAWMLSRLFPLFDQSENQGEAQDETSAKVKSDGWLLVGAWLAGGTFVALLALAQWVAGANLIEAEGVYRVRGPYGSPNNLALYLDRTLAVTLALAVYGQFRLWSVWKIGLNLRMVAAFCAVVQLLALLLTYSRGGTMMALPVTLVVLLVAGWIAFRHDPVRRRQSWWLVAVAMIALLVLAPSLNTERLRGLVDLESGTGFLRRQIWRSGWQMALDNPIFGVGPDNFLYAFRSGYLLPAAWQEPNLNHPHNFVLDLLTRLGIPGLILALAGLGVGLWKIVKNLWRGRLAALNLGLLAAVCAALAHGLIDVSYALPDLMLVWVAIFAFTAKSDRFLRRG